MDCLNVSEEIEKESFLGWYDKLSIKKKEGIFGIVRGYDLHGELIKGRSED
ncbi:hypothetical protein [Sulfurisphaera tokodaii]|uniref:Uncharacterized protein n=1 Tax=Sulfurisphaera tokodaii TaxID=111955 RepID=A0A832WQ37_9CREN|nr:hypothetical protein [Sulfurisphaera tokodaii]HII74615.1 hypothetical protein [Sulfurisphaera tokodaii]